MQTDGRIPEGTPADPQLSGEMLAKANLAFIFALDKNPYLNKWRDAKTQLHQSLNFGLRQGSCSIQTECLPNVLYVY